jgi:hypothetical protein
MREQIFLPLGHSRFAKIVLILQLEATFARRPNGPAHGSQRTDHAMQKLAKERFRRRILLAERHDLVDKTANLLLSLLDQTRVERLFRPHFFGTHNVAGIVECMDEMRRGPAASGSIIRSGPAFEKEYQRNWRLNATVAPGNRRKQLSAMRPPDRPAASA